MLDAGLPLLEALRPGNVSMLRQGSFFCIRNVFFYSASCATEIFCGYPRI